MSRLQRDIGAGIVLLTTALIAAAVAGVILYARGALAHGEAAWIQHEPGYIAASGSHCCGEHDCRRMPADMRARLKPITRGWSLDGRQFAYGTRGMYASVDADWWVCIWGGEVKCIFEPQMGM